MFIKIINFIINLLTKIINFLLNFKTSKLSNELKLISERESKGGNFIEFVLLNNNNLEGEKLCKNIYSFLFNNDKFLHFGESKVIFIAAFNEENEFNFHPNILVNNNTSFNQYFTLIKDRLIFEDYGYDCSDVTGLFVRIWNMDTNKNQHLKITRDLTGKLAFKYTPLTPISKRQYSTFTRSLNVIKPLTRDGTIDSFATLDIETIDFKGVQIPILIALSYHDTTVNHRVTVVTKSFLVDKTLLSENVDIAVNDLWSKFYTFLDTYFFINFKTIFVHNLGGFDGYFIYKYLASSNNKVNTIIDNHNKFILINFETPLGKNIVFKDSLRIFPASLNDLCKVFKMDGKIHPYKKEYNNVTVLDNQELLNELITYCVIDSESLFNVLLRAQQTYLFKYNVDICTIVSTSSLALKIFRKNYQEVEIPILKNNLDVFIRHAYFGGATDYFSCTEKDLKYYDVNSLYPFAMLKPMPLNPTKVDQVKDLDNFFGFVKVRVYCPKSVERPLLPVKYQGKTIFPTGRWEAVLFFRGIESC
jgi:hypothetical protein